MTAKDILKEAFDSDMNLYEKALQSDLEIQKEMLSHILKLMLLLYKKGVITEQEMKDYLNDDLEENKVVNNAMTSAINKQVEELRIEETK